METEVVSEHSYRTRKSLSPFQNRSIEPNGVEKFLATLERKNAEKYNEILNNRIAKLKKEEENSRKQMEDAEKRARVMMNNRERHMSEIREKEMLKALKKQQENELRMKNFMERERHKKNISDMNRFISTSKKNCFFQIKKNQENGDFALKQFKSYTEQQRYEKVQIMKFKAEKKKNNRSKSNFHYKSKLREDYENKIEEEKRLYMESISRRKNLEKIESELLQKISDSQVLTSNFSMQEYPKN